MQAFNIKKELANKSKEVTGLQRAINKAEGKMKALIDQDEAAKKAQDEAKEKADAAEAIAKDELRAALATKEIEIKAADEKAYAEGAADVKEDYKKQVRQACYKGYTLGWMAALKVLAVPEDSALRNASSLALPFSLTPSQFEDKAESEEEAEEEAKDKETEKVEAAGTKSPTLNEQFLDLTHDEEDEVSKGASAVKTSSEAPIAEKSLDQTLKEIDVELAAEKAAEKSFQMSSKP
ncbi:uncharacterized protein LOC114292393 [Camellia sinensis]|uniref:uncharacterized protein LOC114292393 n=1 Tax=Camellia sinensis TaxID=4442 RepID=UPI001036E527|nr:uncharacterized protein LOC114292393 [Camellia sinensis]